MKTPIFFITAAAVLLTFSAQAATRPMRDPAQTARMEHAKELLGKRYKKTLSKTLDRSAELRKVVLKLTRESLSKKWKKQAPRITKAIFDESAKYGFDPLFVVAVIQTESAFNPLARGTSGEIGLMQLMPQTAQWVAKESELKYSGKKTLQDPIQNIKIGTAYLSMLREKFGNDGRLYIPAYNMGPTNVRRNLSQQVIPAIYAKRVMKKYLKIYAEIQSTLERRPG